MMELLAVLLVLTIIVEIIIVLVVRRLSIRTGTTIAETRRIHSTAFKQVGESIMSLDGQVNDLEMRYAELKSIVDVQTEEINDLKSDVLGLQNASANSTRPLEAVVPATPAPAPARRNGTTRKKVGNG